VGAPDALNARKIVAWVLMRAPADAGDAPATTNNVMAMPRVTPRTNAILGSLRASGTAPNAHG